MAGKGDRYRRVNMNKFYRRFENIKWDKNKIGKSTEKETTLYIIPKNEVKIIEWKVASESLEERAK